VWKIVAPRAAVRESLEHVDGYGARRAFAAAEG
jgi:hypothetical protein